MVSGKPRTKFLCDEDFPRTLGKFLKSRGLSIRELPRRLRGRGLPDLQVLRYAIREGCVLLTKDRDFLHNESYAQLIERSPGVIRFVNPPPTTQARARMANQLLKVFSDSRIAGAVLEISETTYRYLQLNRRE